MPGKTPSNTGLEAVQQTTLTGGHLLCREVCRDLGMRFVDEEEFPPYIVDLYLPECHAAIEFDGPDHNAKRDAERDAFLYNTYSLYVMRVRSMSKTTVTEAVDRQIDIWSDDATERIQKYEDLLRARSDND